MFKLRPYQLKAVKALINYFKDKKGRRPIIYAPTGSGKTVIMSEFCRFVNMKWEKKILIISHDKTIIRQNYESLKKQTKNTKIGLYSSGLNKRIIEEITVASIGSIYKSEFMKYFDIIIVDECHAIPVKKNSMYKKFFQNTKKPIIGFSATPFRMGTGFLHKGKNAFFTDIVYKIGIKELQDLGYVCKFTSKETEYELNVDKLGDSVVKDFTLKELSKEFDREYVTEEIVKEMVKYKDKRKKWMVFCIDIEHAENACDILNKYGIKTAVIHSKSKENREKIIEDFEINNKYQALVNVAMLTTGVDIPCVDLIALLRPTRSTSLHIQIIGRGGRPFKGKEKCLVLDFAGNIKRNGPIDKPYIRLKGNSKKGNSIVKICPDCKEIVHAAVKICSDCGHIFKFKHHLKIKSSNNEITSKEKWVKIIDIQYYNHIGGSGVPVLLVKYIGVGKTYKEYICLEHNGYAGSKAIRWWERRSKTGEVPRGVNEALNMVEDLFTTNMILVDESLDFPIIDHKF